MKRRDLIKRLGISAVGIATVPLWLEAWSAEELPKVDFEINEYQKKILSDLVEVIIPATDTPGAKELKVDQFLWTIVADCYEEETGRNLLKGIDELESITQQKLNASFIDIERKERIELLQQMAISSEASDKEFNFFPFVKGLTIKGYMSSKYVMENVQNYQLVPSRWDGSFPVDQSIYTNA